MFGQHPKSGPPLRGEHAKPLGPVTVTPRSRIPSALRSGNSQRSDAALGATAVPGRQSADNGARPVPFDPRRDEKRLVVGKGILMKGEVSACDRLVVEGHVEANLVDSTVVVVAEGGEFKGTADVTDADIGGTFDGTLTVAKRLTVRASGRVSGEVRYGELEVERGGRMSGKIQVGAEARTGGKSATVGKSV